MTTDAITLASDSSVTPPTTSNAVTRKYQVPLASCPVVNDVAFAAVDVSSDQFTPSRDE
jgi:hypothetical protein